MNSYVVFVFCLLGGTQGFLPTRLNFYDPEFVDTFCPEQISSKSFNLKAITREGIRREIRNLFNEDPPVDSDPGFFIEESQSLSGMFHQYYGDEASPTRFYEAVNTVAWANAEMDSMESTKFDPKYHFDGEQINEAQALLADRHGEIVSSLLYNQSYDFARQQLGYSLHAIQDFYSHTTWYDLGNTDIEENLGFPGFTFSNVAGSDDEVCTACPGASGSCTNNVIQNGKLSSGYYEYDEEIADIFIIPKAGGNGKCSHGGNLDTSRTKSPRGGINKASSSPCFSPHFYDHAEVTEMAMEATQYYLSQIRFAIGNDRFKFLFDLYQGSALVIVIDTTGSMSNEIAVVQDQTHQIVENSPAELYILVPYNDPDYGPVTRTTDSQEFLDAVDALSAGGGGGVLEEMVWSALQLALIETPNYSTLYLFTDAGGADYELMDGDIAMAQQKNVICTVIYSYSNGHFTGDPYTDDTDYMNLAAITGGAFIVIDDFTIDDVVAILGDGIETSVVTLAIRRDIESAHTIEAQVDETVSAIQYVISGGINAATVSSPSGGSYNLFDQSSLPSNAVVNAFSTNIIDVVFETPEVGVWVINTGSSSNNYTVTVNGHSTLGFLSEFTEIDNRPPRPNYRLINGQPIAGLTYYIEVVLVGWIENDVQRVTTMEFLNDKGDILSTVSNTEPVDDEFYIESEPLPESRFYVAINGNLNSGTPFTRLKETLITPAKVSVGVDLSLSNLAAPPGTTLEVVFLVFNNGPDATYDFYASDDQGYITDINPTDNLIVSGGSFPVTLTLVIPEDAEPWTQSTIVVTASSQLISYDINSDIAYFIVLPEERDTVPPVCNSNSVPDCTGFIGKDNCDQGTWTAEAVIYDDQSELTSVYTQPSNNDTAIIVTDNTESENFDSVTVSLTASCCITQLSIIGVDSQGNIGTCSYDMGDIDGVLTFEVIDAGTTWIVVEWTVTEVDPDLMFYTLVTDGMLNNDVRCFETTCQQNVTFLQPCSLHTFQLTPKYYRDNAVVEGSTALTTGETLDVVPISPVNGNLVRNENEVTITWDAPENDLCISYYEVCYATDTNTTCASTTTTSLTVLDIYFCDAYTIGIVSVTDSGLRSVDPLMMYTDAIAGVPGPVTDLRMVEITPYTAHLTWDAPATNASCANDYTVNWKPVPTSDNKDLINSAAEPIIIPGEFESVVHPLVPCVDYSFTVWANSPEGIEGPKTTIYDTAGEIEPEQPSNLQVITLDIHSMFVAWFVNDHTCINHFLLCWEHEKTYMKTCISVNGLSYTITGLDSCTGYSITVEAVTPNEVDSPPLRGGNYTDDEVPGAVTNLEFVGSTANTITITFDPPVINPQCVAEYTINYLDVNSTAVQEARMPLLPVPSGAFSNMGDGLLACSYYEVSVFATSPQGLDGPSEMVGGSTTEDLPTAVLDLQTYPVSTTEIEVHWLQPMNNSRCAECYLINWISEAGNPGQDTKCRDRSDQFDFLYSMDNLIPCMEYTIIITPKTESGASGSVSQTNDSTLCADEH